MERRLAAILAADVAGYSHLTEVDEEVTTVTLRESLSIANDVIAFRGGRVFGGAGDSIVAEFPSVVEAVRAAVEIQHKIADRNRATPDVEKMQFRIGINLGDVVVEGNDLFGTGVNVAARLEGLAQPGGICISKTVYDFVRKKVGLEFDSIGEHRVKNIEEPVQVYRLLLESDKTSPKIAFPIKLPLGREKRTTLGLVILLAAAGTMFALYFDVWERKTSTASASIAVLPLINLSDDATQDYFSDGLTDDLITDLTKFSNLAVVASRTSFAYKGKTVNMKEIGRELNVQYLIEGSVQHAGDKLRINAQLIDANTGHHLWAERYDRNMHDLFTLQDEILEKIIKALAIQFDRVELQNAQVKETKMADAYTLWLQGRQIISDPSKETKGGRDEARTKFQDALALDSNYPLAKAGLAYTHIMDWDNEWTDDPDGSLNTAFALAKEAVDSSKDLGDQAYYPHWILGIVLIDKNNYEDGLKEYERAFEIYDGDPRLRAEFGMALTSNGQFDQAITQINQAIEIELIDSPSWFRWALARALYMKKEYKAAITEIERIEKLPNYVRLVWAASYAKLAEVPNTPPDKSTEYRAKAKALIEEYVDIAIQEGDTVWTLEKAQETVFKDKGDLDHWVDGLRLAGLPEK